MAAVILCMASCKTARQSATTRAISAPIVAATTADLNITGQKITYTYLPDGKVRRGGLQNCINAAVREALKENGNADVLVETQEAHVTRKGLFGTKIQSITISGYPAKYSNFQPVDNGTLRKAYENGAVPFQNGESTKIRPFKLSF